LVKGNTPAESIQRLLPIIDKERKKHAKRKAFFVKIKQHFKEGEKILNDISNQLGDDDPIINKFALVMSAYETAKTNIEAFIDRSKGIEEFVPDDMNLLWPNLKKLLGMIGSS